MWAQIHEMLFIEKGGEAQIADELAAYNPLVPKGDELCATVMFEIDDPIRRKAFLSRLGGVEETAFLEFAGHRVAGTPETDVDRTTADGKAIDIAGNPVKPVGADPGGEPERRGVRNSDHLIVIAAYADDLRKIERLAEKKDTERLEQYRNRLNGALDLYCL
jgi:hypothetical protein